MQQNIKFDYLQPDKQLTLDLTVKEAELLISASDEVKGMAEKGDLIKLHERCKGIEDKVDSGYLKVKDQIDRIIQQIEDKEDDLYRSAEGFGVERLKKHHDSSFMDIFGLSKGNPSIENLVKIEAALKKSDGDHKELAHIRNKLHSYIGVKATAFDIKVQLQDAFVEKVSKDDLYH
jgi:hypothetical protein